MNVQNKTAVVIDCANVGWAASYAFSHMTHNDNPIGVIYGVLKSILDITEIFIPNYVLFAWDSMKSRRKLIFPGYKLKDAVDMSEEKMIAKQITEHQLDLLRYEVLPTIGFTNHFYRTGFEADDVMASLALQYNFELFVIVSNDNDMLQCITNSVCVYNHTGNVLIDKNIFFENHGILPNKWAKVKSLCGCTSDKVPGIEGVGENKALRYLAGSLPKDGKIYKRIINALDTEDYKRDTKLVTLPLQQLNFDLQQDQIDVKKFIEVCKEYGLFKLLQSSDMYKWRMIFNNINN
jgi:DNA polymerase I